MSERTWSVEDKLEALMRLPWTVRVETDDHDGSFVAVVQEIPDAIGSGTDAKSLAKDIWESLRASLAIRLEHDDAIPLPAGYRPPWETNANPMYRVEDLITVQHSSHLIVQPVATAA